MILLPVVLIIQSPWAGGEDWGPILSPDPSSDTRRRKRAEPIIKQSRKIKVKMVRLSLCFMSIPPSYIIVVLKSPSLKYRKKFFPFLFNSVFVAVLSFLIYNILMFCFCCFVQASSALESRKNICATKQIKKLLIFLKKHKT